MKNQTSIDSFHKPITIAIADDCKLLRDLLVNSINSLPDFKVILDAENGERLIHGLRDLIVLPDITIIDISMPVMNGYTTQSEIKKRWPQIKSLALSIYDDIECIIQMLKNGANGFINKDSDINLLKEALLAIYNGDDYYRQLPKNIFRQNKGLPYLTEREHEYLAFICTGLNMDNIAEKMEITIRTLEHYRDNVYRKLNVNCKADLLFYVIRTGIVFMK